ncbi:hypothetical protein QSV34_11430 [Porticoccus sp. W117]|uniref:hypothetical protein n=1 Tax=Porticoccus sp. W117 TaxID=3054777 RepID=UPI002591793D|nr:hypothetical protein [Porticoccus sp. W117]MDM3871958.1 hypothetical protein [Porticoccus sp. W117]
MKALGLTTALLLVLATAPASADSRTYELQSPSDEFANYQGDYLLAHGGDRHYRTHKHRKHRKYRRHHRKHHRNHYRDRGHRDYDYHLDFHIYPYYRSDRHYRHHKRNYRRHYRNHRRHHRYRDYRCDYRNDGLKWLAGAVVASELLHYAFDNPQDEWHYSDHREYRADNWADSNYQEHTPAPRGDHEQHYRSYHAARYGG